MRLLVAYLNLGLGMVYTSYGLMTAVDLKRGWRTGGFSHFGAAWLAMAFTCGPHHLEHGLHQLAGRPGGPLELFALVAGAPAGVTWFLLRIEAMQGGRGDRPLTATPWWLRLAPLLAAAYVAVVVAGVLVVVARHGGTFDPRGTPSVLLVGLYTMVGYYLLRTQLHRHRTVGGWSTSGVALTAVFPTCAVMHLSWLAYAATGTYDIDWHLLTIDWLSVPAAVYFLWVVRALALGTLSDWNRTAVAGAGVRIQPA